MARPTPKTSADYTFGVSQVPLYTRFNGREVASGYYSNQRTDSGHTVGVTSEKYGLVKNSELVDIAREGFKANGLKDYDEQLFVAREGSRFFGVYDFKNEVSRIPRKGDEIGMRFTLNNSYDRTCRVGISIGMLRLVCENGMTSLENEQGMTARHSSTVTLGSIAGAIDGAIAGFHRSVDNLAVMNDREITHDQGVIILNNLSQKKVLSESLKDSIEFEWNNPKREEDKARNLFNLYNATTAHLTSDVAQSRWEYAQKVDRGVLGRLSQAAHDPAILHTLLLPVKKEEAVTVTLV